MATAAVQVDAVLRALLPPPPGLAAPPTISPPPGLGEAAGTFLRAPLAPKAPPLRGAVACDGHAVGVRGWTQAVASVAPFLDSDGLREAVRLLDEALEDMQHIRVFNEMLREDCILEVDPNLQQWRLRMRGQLQDRQGLLLAQLKDLPVNRGVRAATHQPQQQQRSLAPAWREELRQEAPAWPAQAARPLFVEGQSVTPPGLDACAAWSPLPAAAAVCARPVARPSEAARSESSELPKQAPFEEQRAEGGVTAESKGPTLPRQKLTLSASLQLLGTEDPDCLFVVRRVNRLGFEASRILRGHFEQYGPVVRVLLAQSTVRPPKEGQGHPRRRPSSFGFVQMASVDAVQKILAEGSEHHVRGLPIVVQRFERHVQDEPADLSHGALEARADAGKKVAWGTQDDRAVLSHSALEACADVDTKVAWGRQESAQSTTASADSTDRSEDSD